MAVGAFGLGSRTASDIPGKDYSNISISGFYAGVGRGTSGVVPPKTSSSEAVFGAVIAAMGTNDDAFIVTANLKEMYFRTKSSAAWSETFYRVYGSGNTTVASDGTIKAASPIVKIFSDGQAETNDESKGCKVERLSVGQYLITGCMGMNADGSWGGIDGGFDIPNDRNGQPLIWLDYEVNADGSVLVKTYHRTYPDSPKFARNEITGLEDGQPVDIPADQFVSVRVEMPSDSIWNQRQAAMQAQQEAEQAQE